MKHYGIVVEKAEGNYSAYIPDLPGCVTTGTSVDETISNMQEALSIHLETMQGLGIQIPGSTKTSDINVCVHKRSVDHPERQSS